MGLLQILCSILCNCQVWTWGRETARDYARNCVTMTGYGSVGTDPRSDANVVSGNRDCADPRGARGANGNCSVTYFLDPTGSIALTLSNELWQMSQLCFSKRKIRRRNRDSGGGLLLLRGRLHRQSPQLHPRQRLRQRSRMPKEP